ncbi:MAG: PBP1A family penicillin-binding protein [Treponema sp.]|nr:PBP1A family penicillin-binding protein [Treponema sp.]
MENIKKSTIVQISILFGTALIFGGVLGWGLSETRNIENSEYITQFDTALPTKLLDINGELITELASDEKREIISLEKLPQLMIDALLTREDRIFYEHRGFSCKAVARAFAGKLLHLSLGGGSTLTQQIAGTLYCDRTDMTIRRKVKELWWAIQMERRCSKNEILETYLNKIYFGGGTYGVNAASKYYFGHSATDITPAEAAILVIQLSNPAYYNPFDHPNRAMERQKDVLNSMVREGYISKAEADESFDTYWADFDYTRTSSSAYFMRDDRAPWFSEYVRRELGGMIYGAEDIYTSGFTVNTTLDLTQQAAATDVMQRYIAYANRTWKREQSNRSSTAFKTYVPLSELLSLVFNLPSMKMSKERSMQIANDTFVNQINPILDVYSMMFGLESLKVGIVNKANSISMQEDEKTTIEGTMIALQNDTGYITALVGGSKYDQDNQLIRAVQSKLQPGSTFKPLYYSAAIDSRKFTPATEISDTPVVFHKSDGTPYIPQNFKGEWKGNVQLWYALAHSMNVPSLKVLDGIGFDAAIERTSSLLGIPQNELTERHFLPVYPLGLGVCSVRPVEMARAFAIFANSGKEVTPMAIRTVEDRNGNVVLNPELDIRKAQQAKGSSIQIISPQTAFVMTQMLENTVQSGTLIGQGAQLTYKNDKGRSYTIPLAGKTGTTQNWADAWTVAFSPYYTSAFWFGFDKPGNSLGLHITGATLAGIAMGEFMGKIHKGLPYKDFAMPAAGVVKVTVCADSGLLPTPECPVTTQWFLSGTEPTEVCTIHSNSSSTALFYDRLEKEMYKSGQRFTDEINSSPLSLDLNFLNDNTQQHTNEQQTEQKQDKNTPDYNYLMD